MSPQEIKNQITSRFVSLRRAELLKKENQDKHFVSHPNQSAVFFNAVKNKNNYQSKWKAMQQAALIFSN